RPGDIRGAGLPVAAGPFRSPVRIRSPAPPPAPDATPRPTADDPEPCPVAAGRPAQRTQGGGLRPGRRPGTFAEQACRLRRGRPDATGPPKSRALCPRPSTQGNPLRTGRTSIRSYTPASTYGSASTQARASSSDPNSATTRLPLNPAGPGSSASIAGHGPASSSRPASRSASSRARCAARACCRRASTSAPSCPSIAYHIAVATLLRSPRLYATGAGQPPDRPRTLAAITGRPGSTRRRQAFTSSPGSRRPSVARSACCRGMHGFHRCQSMTPEPASGTPAGTAGHNGSTPPQQQEMPLAMVLGQPVVEIPRDLYIPPDALEVILDAFEGPLDLLLYLIRRQNLDILDIPVAEITRQYV